MNTYKRKTRITNWGLLIFVVLLNFVSALAHESDSESRYLSVTLNDPYNADVQVRIAIKIGKPFQITLENGEVKTVISGTVRDPIDNEYPATITISEWASATSTKRETSELRLKLDQPHGYGPVSSFVYFRTVTLSKKSRP